MGQSICLLERITLQIVTDKLKQIKSICNIARAELSKRPFDSKRDQARTLAFLGDIERILAQVDRRAVKKYYGYTDPLPLERPVEEQKEINEKGINEARETLNRRRNR